MPTLTEQANELDMDELDADESGAFLRSHQRYLRIRQPAGRVMTREAKVCPI